MADLTKFDEQLLRILLREQVAAVAIVRRDLLR